VSLWLCPAHGLYGGQVHCPRCGTIGVLAEVHHEQGSSPTVKPAPNDSIELAWLRLRYRKCTPGSQATAWRLGRFASDTRTKISDFGAHSKRWIACFELGHTQATARRRILGQGLVPTPQSRKSQK
jgi:hypothetical protein